MLRPVAIGFLLAALACTFEVSLGPGDGVRTFKFEADIPNPALKKDGQIVLTRDFLLIDEMRSQRYLESFGPDKIGALRRVTLTVVDVRIEGVDLAVTGPPTLVIAGHSLPGAPGAMIELDDGQVAWLRDKLLAAEPVVTSLTVDLQTPAGALDARLPSLHIIVEIQPTLVIDATEAL
jgi:hypothetical protein